MPSDREGLKLAGVELNDGTSFDTEEFTFTPAAKKPQWVSNSDADGEVLVREANYTNAYMEFTLRVAHQETADAAREALGELTDALQGCERTKGGATLLWTPHNSETVYTAYAVLAEYTAIPIVVQGDDAGWFLNAPRVRVKLTLRPFLYRPERTALEAEEGGATPAQKVFVGEIKGDVPAEARLIVTDKSSQNRRFAAWGRDIVDEAGEALSLNILAASLVTEGFSGEAKTRSGAYSEEKVKRAVAVSSATTMCSTGSIEHVGSFAVYLRVYAASENARFRISYRNGDGPLVPLKWVTPPVVENFSYLYMGEVFLDEVTLGEQSSEIRIEHKSAGAAHENDVNYLLLLPTRASLKARGIANNTPTKLLAYDQFEQTEGALSGKNLNGPGTITWSGAGDADDFTVIAASDVARRTATSDTNTNTGRYAIAGSSEYESVEVSVGVTTTDASTNAMRFGVFARYSSTENWLAAVISRETGATYIEVLKRVSGTVTSLGGTKGYGGITPSSAVTGAKVTLRVAADGTWSASVDSGSEPFLSGQDSALATGGALAKGKVGIYDAWTSGSANTRSYDNFIALGADAAGIVCYSGKSIEFNHQGVLREDEAGETWGQPDLPRGANFYLEPAGADGRINRIVLLMRRNDVEVEADANVEDKHTTEIKVRERFLAPR